MSYLWQSEKWPHFTWNKEEVSDALLEVTLQKGLLNGKMSAMGFEVSEACLLESMSSEVVSSEAIESHKISTEDVRSSIVNQLCLKNVVLSDLHSNETIETVNNNNSKTDSVVKVSIDAIKNCNQPLTIERLCQWQKWILPESEFHYPPIHTGKFRTDERGPMQVVSGPIGREKVHYQAPPAEQIQPMVEQFINWFNTPSSEQNLNHMVKSAIAHLYFVSIHPFEDGNGRISRAIADMELSKENTNNNRIDHLFSISVQLCKDRTNYYENLKKVQAKQDMDITAWIIWYLDSLKQAIMSVLKELDMVLERRDFWNRAEGLNLNQRQKRILNLLISNKFEGNLTSSKWAKICKCSQDTASRDINRLIETGILKKSEKSGRSTNYLLVQKDS